MQDIELPLEWTSSKRQAAAAAAPCPAEAAKRAKADPPHRKDIPLQTAEVCKALAQPHASKAAVRDKLIQTILDADEEAGIQSLEVDSLLSRLPYKKMMADLFGGGISVTAPHVPYITRAYEDSFMRERMHPSERLCAKGSNCECMFIDAGNAFTAVEFLLPGEQKPDTPHMCVVCCRAATQQLYYDIVYDKEEFHGCIQRHGNIHGQEGEYALEAMLVMPPHAPPHIMPLPIVAHQRNRYQVQVHSGVRHLKQMRVHFQSAPSLAA